MMKDRRLQVMAENQALMMRAMAEFLLAQRGVEGKAPLSVHVEKLALKIASRGEDLQELIDDGFLAVEVWRRANPLNYYRNLGSHAQMRDDQSMPKITVAAKVAVSAFITACEVDDQQPTQNDLSS